MENKFYKDIDNALKEYENHKAYKTRRIEWIADRIDWCWKWRKITEKQMEELVDRFCEMVRKIG